MSLLARYREIMPAKHLTRVDLEKVYLHIFNRGVESKVIFADSQDYETFLGFLKDYLTKPSDPESKKQTFTVNGRTFKGTPHQPKNYFGKVELVAYCLMPDHFHLVLHQITKGALESFVRSLSTRYSMYFNKKHNRRGALFQGPYKSVHLDDSDKLVQLTGYLHLEHEPNSYSSHLEYLGERETQWVKAKIVITALQKIETGYKNFSKDYRLTDSTLTLESNSQPYPADATIIPPTIQRSHNHNYSRKFEFLAIGLVFLLLSALGVRSIKAAALANQTPLAKQQINK